MIDPKDRPFSPEKMEAILAAVATLVSPDYHPKPMKPYKTISEILRCRPEGITDSMMINGK